MPHFFAIAFIKHNANEIIFFFLTPLNSDSYLLDWSILATVFARTRLIFFVLAELLYDMALTWDELRNATERRSSPLFCREYVVYCYEDL